MNSIRQYGIDLQRWVASGWEIFWFSPRSPLTTSVLRILSGVMAMAFLLSHTTDLVRWFGPHGLLPGTVVQRLIGADSGQTVYRFSHLFYVDSPTGLYVLHAFGLAIVAAFTCGWLTRITNVLSLIVVLAYVHRAPMITGQFEPVLTMLLAYLCLAPSGAFMSVDAWLRAKRKVAPPEPGISANISVRLIQLHIAAMCLMTGLTMLAGQVWWSGEAVWVLIAKTETRLVDLSFLHQQVYLINVATHGIILFLLSWPLLVWNRTLRPLMLAVAVGFWELVAVLSGLLAYCLAMLLAQIAFLSTEQLRAFLTRLLPRLGPATRLRDASVDTVPAAS